MIKPPRLLAKSGSKGIDLWTHSKAVACCATEMFGHPKDGLTAFGRAWLTFFGIETENASAFLKTLLVASWLHDCGKANNGFQAAVRSAGEQRVRHEHISAVLLLDQPMHDWLTSQVDLEIVIAAVLSHHLKANDGNVCHALVEGDYCLECLQGDIDFAHILESLATDCHLSPPPGLLNKSITRGQMMAYRNQARRAARRLQRETRDDELRLRLLCAVKAGLIISDAAGSALVREGLDLSTWLSGCFQTEPLSGDFIDHGIINPRIREIESHAKEAFQWRDWQLCTGDLPPRALLLSPCGSGKTLAAWKWVRNRLACAPASRAIFLYPTRGTATEGFRDYVSWAGGEAAALLHGTSDYDLEGLFQNPDDLRHGEEYRTQERLFALSYWNKRIFSATVDQFLSFLKQNYGSLCLLSVLAQSVVVIDEVHSFDRLMFGSLERFLKFFRVPVLCMTATLPEDRQRVLVEECGLEVFPKSLADHADLSVESTAPRYRVRHTTQEQSYEHASEARRQGQKVLWVVNTVARCQDVTRNLRKHLGADKVKCYHSRFRLKDRRERHEEVIACFRSPLPVVLVATQVCEMSLDLDADVLITELAPVPSMIQRMGRCFRRPASGRDEYGKVFVYQPPSGLPYESTDLVQAGEFITQLAPKREPVSQAFLSEWLAAMEVRDAFAANSYAGFLDAGMFAMSWDEQFRESHDITADAVLDSDLNGYLRLSRQRSPEARGLICPVPRRFAVEDSCLPGRLRVAPGSQYCADLGFSGAELNDG